MATGQQPMFFIFPSRLEFFVDDPSSHKAILSVFNPFEHSLRYKLYSTVPDRYKVVEGEGIIRSGACADIVIRHQEVALYRRREINVDHFRIKVYKDKTFIGQRDVPAVLLHSKKELPNEQHNFLQLPTESKSQQSSEPASDTEDTQESKVVDTPKRPSLLYVYIGIFCLAVLYMPVDGEQRNFFSDYITLENSHKLIAAYVLGMITIVLFRQ